MLETLKASRKPIADRAHVVRMTGDVRFASPGLEDGRLELFDGELGVFKTIGRRDDAAGDECLELGGPTAEVHSCLQAHCVWAIANGGELDETRNCEMPVL